MTNKLELKLDQTEKPKKLRQQPSGDILLEI